MNRSKGSMFFHRLFSAQEIGLGTNAAQFTTAVISQFLKIGEAVAARWIEMPQGVLILQIIAGRADSGAIYFYDRKQQIFYMIAFDGPDDNLTLEDFNQLLVEYDLIRFAEHPNLIELQPSPPPVPPPPPLVFEVPLLEAPAPGLLVQEELNLLLLDSIRDAASRGLFWYPYLSVTHRHFQSIGSA